MCMLFLLYYILILSSDTEHIKFYLEILFFNSIVNGLFHISPYETIVLVV